MFALIAVCVLLFGTSLVGTLWSRIEFFNWWNNWSVVLPLLLLGLGVFVFWRLKSGKAG